MALPLDQRPAMVAIAGPNGAGKTTFYYAHLQAAGLHFVNADTISRELSIDPYTATAIAHSLRQELVRQRASFAFETVFSDPVGDKLSFLRDVVRHDYTVVLCYIGISGPDVSEERVAMRISQGGHDVPAEKLVSRYPRILRNLRAALRSLPHVWVYDNDDLRHPFRLKGVCEDGRLVELHRPVPGWLRPLLPAR